MCERMNMYQTLMVDGVSYSRNELMSSMIPDLIRSGIGWQIQIGEFISQWLDENDSIIVRTSGSTGNAKEIAISKTAMICSAQKTIRFFDLKPQCKALLCLPAAYIAGRMMLVRAFVGQWDIHFQQPNHLTLEGDSRFDFAAIVPLQAEQLLADGFDFTRLKTVIVGGAPCSDALRQSLAQFNIWESYGMTETVSHIALRKMDQQWFSPIEKVVLSVDDRHCLCIDAPGISDSGIMTNDVVEMSSDGRFRFLGRADHVINSGGIKFFPEQIEQKIKSCLTTPFAIIGLPDDRLGEKLALVVESNQIEEGIMDLLRQHLDRYETPKTICCLNPLLYTPNGKLDRRAIRQNILTRLNG